jgi:hypothetical protein
MLPGKRSHGRSPRGRSSPVCGPVAHILGGNRAEKLSVPARQIVEEQTAYFMVATIKRV